MKNIKNIKKILRNARRVGLEPKEKTNLKDEFVKFMEAHPAQKKGVLFARVFSFKKYSLPSLTPYFAGVALVILVGSGVSSAANKSLPGDFLYPVKVSVNEEVVGLFYTTPESKFKYETHRLGERLEEAQQLAMKNLVNQDSWKDISSSLNNHITIIKKYIETQDLEPIAKSSTSTLTASSSVSSDSATSSESSGEKDLDMESYGESTDKSGSDKNMSPTSSSTKPSPSTSASSSLDQHEVAIEDKSSTGSSTSTERFQLNASSEHIENIKNKINDSETVTEDSREKIIEKLSESNNLFREGLKKLGDKKNNDALELFLKAQKIMEDINKEITIHNKAMRTKKAGKATSTIEELELNTSTSTSKKAGSSSPSTPL